MCLFASAEIWVLLRTTNWREIAGLCALSGMEAPEKIIKIITSLSLNWFASLTRGTVLKFHQKKHSDITISPFEPEMKKKKSTYALSEWRLKHVFAESTTCSLWSRAALRCDEGWWTRSCFPHKAELRGRLVHWQNRVLHNMIFVCGLYMIVDYIHCLLIRHAVKDCQPKLSQYLLSSVEKREGWVRF